MPVQLPFALLAGAVTTVAAWLVLTAAARERARLERALGIGAAEPATRWAFPRPSDLVAALGRPLPRGPFDALGGRLPEGAAEGQQRLVRGIGAVLIALVLALGSLNAAWLFGVFACPRLARALVERERRAAVRRERLELEREVTPALDVLVIALEGGLPFDRAVTAYVETTGSILARELGVTVRELEVGYRRREALDRLVARTGSPGLGALAKTVRLAEDFGTPVADAVRTLATEMRAQRRQRLQEAALRAPVTMLLPTAGFILPPIFAIILGPIVIRVASGTLF